MNSTVQDPYRVLTIDGGGMRGLYSAMKLKLLVDRFNPGKIIQAPDIGATFDLICGVSTGAILGAGLAAGVPLSTILDLYRTKGKEIFGAPKPRPEESTGIGPLKCKKIKLWALKHRNKPSSNPRKLKSALLTKFGTETLGQLYARRHIGLCVPCVNAVNHAPSALCDFKLESTSQ